MKYSQAGNYIVIAGLIVEIVNKKVPGLGITSDQVMFIIGGIITAIGSIHQWISHRKLAQVAGAIPR